MRAVRALGRELMNASPAELCIGNVVIRVLYFIREDYSQKLRAVEESGGVMPLTIASSKRSSRAGSEGDLSNRRDRGYSVASSAGSERAEEAVDFVEGVDIESDAPTINQISKKISEASLSGRYTIYSGVFLFK